MTTYARAIYMHYKTSNIKQQNVDQIYLNKFTNTRPTKNTDSLESLLSTISESFQLATELLTLVERYLFQKQQQKMLVHDSQQANDT